MRVKARKNLNIKYRNKKKYPSNMQNYFKPIEGSLKKIQGAKGIEVDINS